MNIHIFCTIEVGIHKPPAAPIIRNDSDEIAIDPYLHHNEIIHMMTSSNGNIFRVIGPLWEFTGHRWIPSQRPVTWSFDVFFDLRLNKRLSDQSRGWWFETPSHPLWRHCNDVAIHTCHALSYLGQEKRPIFTNSKKRFVPSPREAVLLNFLDNNLCITCKIGMNCPIQNNRHVWMNSSTTCKAYMHTSVYSIF